MVQRRHERTQTVDVAAGTAQQRRTSATTAAQKAETLNSVSDRTTTCALKMASQNRKERCITMTRKEMITKCVEDQIARGITKEESKDFQIKARLKGYAGCKPMSYSDCRRWYEEVFE